MYGFSIENYKAAVKKKYRHTIKDNIRFTSLLVRSLYLSIDFMVLADPSKKSAPTSITKT